MYNTRTERGKRETNKPTQTELDMDSTERIIFAWGFAVHFAIVAIAGIFGI